MGNSTPNARAFSVVALLLSSACGSAEFASDQIDAGSPNSARDSGTDNTPITELPRIQEDFVNSRLIREKSGVIQDVNTGTLRLPVVALPVFDGVSETLYVGNQELNGVVNGSEIVVDEDAELRASDSLDLVARDRLHIAGRVYAGRGGISLSAGTEVVIDGIVEAEGPIHIALGSETGRIVINGRITAIAPTQDTHADVTLSSRGTVEVYGSILTQAGTGMLAGAIRVDSYGSMTLDGGHLGSAVGEHYPGPITIRSETELVVKNAARLGGGAAGDGASSQVPGNIELSAPHIRVASSTISGSGSGDDSSGLLSMSAEDLIEIEDGAHVIGARGHIGGSMLIHAGALHIGTNALIQGGRGVDGAGAVTVSAANAIELESGARIFGGDAACGDGGDLRLYVGGPLRIATGAEIGGGSGISGACISPTDATRGGFVEIIAREFIGDHSRMTVRPGGGILMGEVVLSEDRTFVVEPPPPSAATSGYVESEVIDRGEANVGKYPVLTNWVAELPARTSLTLELIGGATPAATFDGEWTSLELDIPSEALANARYLRYRVTLVGRRFDTPVLDYFEIDLGPRN